MRASLGVVDQVIERQTIRAVPGSTATARTRRAPRTATATASSPIRPAARRPARRGRRRTPARAICGRCWRASAASTTSPPVTGRPRRHCSARWRAMTSGPLPRARAGLGGPGACRPRRSARIPPPPRSGSPRAARRLRQPAHLGPGAVRAPRSGARLRPRPRDAGDRPPIATSSRGMPGTLPLSVARPPTAPA